MVLSASPASISVPSLFQEAHTNLSIVVGLQRSRFICRYKLCVALLKLIIVFPSSFAWRLINCSIVKGGRISYQVCIRLSDHSCAWCEAGNKPSVPPEVHIWIMQLLCELSHLWARGTVWQQPCGRNCQLRGGRSSFVCALLNNSKMR